MLVRPLWGEKDIRSCARTHTWSIRKRTIFWNFTGRVWLKSIRREYQNPYRRIRTIKLFRTWTSVVASRDNTLNTKRPVCIRMSPKREYQDGGWTKLDSLLSRFTSLRVFLFANYFNHCIAGNIDTGTVSIRIGYHSIENISIEKNRHLDTYSKCRYLIGIYTRIEVSITFPNFSIPI